MRAFLPFLAAMAIAAPAAAQSPAPSGEKPADAAASAPAAEASAASSLSAGLAVKDKTGATIGQVADVKADASGKTMATIKMGADTFAVDAASLAVDDGAAVINATQAEIKDMMKKK